jgi:ribonuclease HI
MVDPVSSADSQRPHVLIYTDGACAGNPGPGGWAALLIAGEREKVLTGGASHTTNNRMELRAALAGLSALKVPCVVELHTDSEYLKKGMSGWVQMWVRTRWRTASGAPVKNQDLWRKLLPLIEKHEVRWVWVRGHAGDPRNERVDALARQAIDAVGRGAPADMEA